MSTYDVPGANAINQDVLDIGCWAEHQDGSFILVEGFTDSDKSVVYSIFDTNTNPPVSYRDTMLLEDFYYNYSTINEEDVKWLWHDKTPFPWEKFIIDKMPMSQRVVLTAEQISVAKKVADDLGLNKTGLTINDIEEKKKSISEKKSISSKIRSKIGKALYRLSNNISNLLE